MDSTGKVISASFNRDNLPGSSIMRGRVSSKAIDADRVSGLRRD